MSEVTATAVKNQKAIVFQLDDKEYSISVHHVISIEKIKQMTRVPNLPSHIKGVINLRGVIVPIIDLKRRLELGEIEVTKNTRVIIISYNNMEVGFMVDAADDVLDYSDDDLEPRPDTVTTVEAEFIHGVIKLDKRLLIHLDLDHILESKQMGM